MKYEPGVIYIDRNVGSKEFLPILTGMRHRRKAALADLLAGDFVFRCGHTKKNPLCAGEYGCKIAVERKTLSDLAGSLLKGRLKMKQIPDMLTLYTMSWIVVEGIWRPGADDAIESFIYGQWRDARVPLTYSQLNSWLVKFDVGGDGKLHRWRTSTDIETAAWIVSLWSWWQKEYDKHDWDGMVKHAGLQLAGNGRVQEHKRSMVFRPTQLQLTLYSLPEVGSKAMRKAGRHFPSILDAMNADVDQWRAAGLGKKDAVTVVSAIRKRYR